MCVSRGWEHVTRSAISYAPFRRLGERFTLPFSQCLHYMPGTCRRLDPLEETQAKDKTKQNKKPCRRFCPATCKANRRQQTVADATLPDRTAANGGLGWGPAPSKGNTRHVEQPLLLFSFRFDSGSLLLVLARAREFIRERPRRPHDELKRVGCES